MIKNYRQIAFTATAILFLLIACKRERDPCLQPRIVDLRAGTYHHADTGTAIFDTLLQNPIQIALDATNTNANVYYYGTKTNNFIFSLNNAADSTRWILRPDSVNISVQDTITFHYIRQLEFLSTACGYTYFYSLSTVNTTHHAIDSVLINNSAVTSTANVQHVKIYY